MSLRIFDRAALLMCFALAGCGGGQDDGEMSAVMNILHRLRGETDPQPEGITVPCGPASVRPVLHCTLAPDRLAGAGHVILRRPDGGFRRLLWTAERNWQAADGAEAIDIRNLGRDGVEMRIDGWRYRLLRPEERKE